MIFTSIESKTNLAAYQKAKDRAKAWSAAMLRRLRFRLVGRHSRNPIAAIWMVGLRDTKTL
jgi:hypothetical protein